MANFTPTKKQVSDFNNGIKYVNKVDTPSADDFNNVIESQLYSQNFAESIADTPDTSEASQVGVPSVTLINNIKNGVVYKKFKFANMKGDSGAVNGNFLNAFGTSTINGYSQAQTNKLVANPNLGINGDFSIDQLGLGTYVLGPTGFTHNFDGYKGQNLTITQLDGGGVNMTSLQTATYKRCLQVLEEPLRAGTPYTLSALIKVNSKGDGFVGLRIIDNTFTGLAHTTLAVSANYVLYSVSYTPTEDIFDAGFEILATNTTTAHFDLDLRYWKIETGSVATAYTPPLKATALASCQRYYIDFGAVISTQTVQPIVGTGVAYTSTLAYVFIPTPVTLRQQGTFIYNLSKMDIWSNGATQKPTELVNYALSSNGVAIRLTGNFTVGQAVLLRFSDNTRGILAYDARL